ncbi:hypothetical protein ZWY2020_006658 [Hordeum vulgare]|nr:hypothetical protein ZWY2020_006658 [Hordeum vulgare]
MDHHTMAFLPLLSPVVVDIQALACRHFPPKGICIRKHRPNSEPTHARAKRAAKDSDVSTRKSRGIEPNRPPASSLQRPAGSSDLQLLAAAAGPACEFLPFLTNLVASQFLEEAHKSGLSKQELLSRFFLFLTNSIAYHFPQEDSKPSGSKVMDADETLPASGDANNSEQQPHDTDKKSRVEDMWKKMNSGLPAKMPKPAMVKLKTAAKEKKTKATNNNWMTILGLPPKKVSANDQVPKNEQQQTQQKTSEDTKKLAANALAAVKDAATAASGRGKVEEAVEKASAVGAAPSAVDNILEQIRKKQKLSVLDKAKKDWGEYKVERRGGGAGGIQEELEPVP